MTTVIDMASERDRRRPPPPRAAGISRKDFLMAGLELLRKFHTDAEIVAAMKSLGMKWRRPPGRKR